jgi:hypothetical protein
MSDEIVRAQRTSVSHIVTVPSEILREVFMTIVATEKFLHDVPDEDLSNHNALPGHLRQMHLWRYRTSVAPGAQLPLVIVACGVMLILKTSSLPNCACTYHALRTSMSTAGLEPK